MTWLDEAVAAQARILTGGTRRGPFVQPTVITGIRAGMKVYDQEIFGPVVAIMPFDTLSDAIDGANDTPFGLAAGIFTSNYGAALEAAKKLRFGGIHINETSSSRVDGMPFGGVKDSGFGHEGPKYAIRDLTEERLVTFSA
jgi:succinate-semialdehyde dehydrogenase/glutarate-semialdehyde dehydrogenase